MEAALARTGLNQRGFNRMLELEDLAPLYVRSPGKGRHQVFEEDRLVEAATSYVRRETVEQAAVRLGVDSQRLGRAVRHFGAKKKSGRYWALLLPEEFDVLLRQWNSYCASKYTRLAETLTGRKRKGRS
jgi:hypothetical protein